jgi:hypothetical protein
MCKWSVNADEWGSDAGGQPNRQFVIRQKHSYVGRKSGGDESSASVMTRNSAPARTGRGRRKPHRAEPGAAGDRCGVDEAEGSKRDRER